jgi:predicted amidohydrolase YtcJ
MQRFIAAVLCVAGLHFAAGAQSRATTTANLIFTNGKIVTLDAKTRIASAVAIGGDHILAVGTDTEALALRGSSTKVVDLRGKSVIPALEDSHIHFLGLGRDIARRADFTFAKSAEDIVKTVQELKTRINAKPGDWLMGTRWDQYKYPSMATRWQLDEVTPNNPVRLSRTYRGVLVNTAVFRLMKIDDSNSSTWPAWWLRDPATFTFEDKIFREKRTLTVDGKQQTLEIPTGVFLGRNGSALLTARPPSARDFEDDVESVRLGVLEMLRLGVGSIVDPDSPGDYNMRVFQEAQKRGFLLIRVPGVYFGSVYHQTPEELVKLLKPVNMNVPSDDFLRWRGTKYYADGGVGSRSAWVSEPFTYVAAEGKENYGEPEMADYDKREALHEADG